MSGSVIPVCGLRLIITPNVEPYTDPVVCSVFYQVVGHINNDDVRTTLQGILALGNPDKLPQVNVKSTNDPNSDAKDYTISNELLQVYLPFTEVNPNLPAVEDVADSAICLAMIAWGAPLSDSVRIPLAAAARLGVQTLAQNLGKDAAQFS